MLMRYSATPGIAQRTIAIAETISGCKRRRPPSSRIAKIEATAMTADWARASAPARRNKVRLRSRSPAASERAINVVMALSRPKMPTLLRMSVTAQAIENMPRAAGPSSQATSRLKSPRKFDASMAMALKNIPRFSSTPVSSTRSRESSAGGMLAVVLTALSRSLVGSLTDAGTLRQSVRSTS